MTELIREYLARGGQVTKCPARPAFGVPSRPVPLKKYLVR